MALQESDMGGRIEPEYASDEVSAKMPKFNIPYRNLKNRRRPQMFDDELDGNRLVRLTPTDDLLVAPKIRLLDFLVFH